VFGASARLWITALLLLGWHAPALAAVGIGMHLASDDHERQEMAIELALATSHGHHHELTVALHDHSAVRVAAPSAPPPEVSSMVSEPAFVVPAAPVGRAPQFASPPRTGPPQLFYTHCALLL
jgi:hypothetical protein